MFRQSYKNFWFENYTLYVNKAKTGDAHKFSAGVTNFKSIASESITLPDLAIHCK